MTSQAGARHLAETEKWLAWRRDLIIRMAVQLAAAWQARLKVSRI